MNELKRTFTTLSNNCQVSYNNKYTTCMPRAWLTPDYLQFVTTGLNVGLTKLVKSKVVNHKLPFLGLITESTVLE